MFNLTIEQIHMIITAIVLVAVFYAFVKEKFPAHVTAMSAMAILLLTGVIDTNEALSVFSNPAPITIACMFVLSAALQKTGVIDLMGSGILRVAEYNRMVAVVLLLGCVMVASAFMNNTPIVIIMAPIMISMAHKFEDYPSKYLIPLSYVAIMGGTCTLIGSSTNILVDGVAQLHGQKPFSMFELTYAGGILAVLGSIFLALFAKKLLPERAILESEFVDDISQKRFLAEAVILRDSPLIGKTLNEIRFTSDANYEIVDLVRNNEGNRLRNSIISALKDVLSTKKDEISEENSVSTLRDLALQAGDKLVFKTDKDELMEMNKLVGITFDTLGSEANLFFPVTAKETMVEEGVVGLNSDFIGKSPADLRLRRRYGCYIIAIHRDNMNITKDFDKVRFRYGDTMILEGAKDDLARLFQQEEILGVSQFSNIKFDRKKAPIAIASILSVVVLSAMNVMPIAGLALIASMLVILSKCVEFDKIYESVEWKMLMIIFGTLSLSIAMEHTGLASLIAANLANYCAHLGPIAVLAIVYLLTSFLTEIISNNAAAVLLTPVAIGLAHSVGVDPRPFIVAVMFAASASFATPIGYQTNTYVYNIGNYKFNDFLKIGLLINVLMLAAAVAVIPMFWSF